MPEADLLAAGVQPWVHLPLWLPPGTARTAWDVDTTRARELGLPSRPLRGDGGRHLGVAAGVRAAARCRPAPPRARPAARARGAAPRRPAEPGDLSGAGQSGRREAPPGSCRAGPLGSVLSRAGRSGRPAGTCSSAAGVAGRLDLRLAAPPRRRWRRRTPAPGPCGTRGRSTRRRRPRSRRSPRRRRSGCASAASIQSLLSSVRVLVRTIMPPTSEPSIRGGMCRTSQAAIGAAIRPPSSRAATQAKSMPCEPSASRKPRLAASGDEELRRCRSSR